MADLAEAYDAVDLGDDGRVARLAGLEELDDAGQTAGDVLGAGGFARDLGKDVAGEDLVAISNHEVSARRHEVTLVAGGGLDDDGGLTLLVGGVGNDETREAGDFVDFFVEGDAFLQVLELDGAGDLGEEREGVGIPLAEAIALLDRGAVFDLQLGAVDDGVTLLLAALVVDDGDGAVAVEGDQAAILGADGDEVDEADGAGVLGLEVRGVGDARCGAADVEGTHGELGAGLADGLRRDDADGFAHLDHLAGAEVTAVAEDADAALGLAGEDGANLDALDTRSLNRGGEVFVDLLVDFDDGLALEVLEALERDAADDAVAEGLDGLAGFDDGGDVDAFDGAAVVVRDDDILRDVDETAGEVSGVGGLEGGVGETLARAVRGDEVLQHGEAFTEVRRDGGLDDFAGRLGHQTTHAGELADLLLGASGAGVGHDVDRVHGAVLVGLLHVVEHFVGDALGDAGPHLDDLVGALTVGDGTVEVLLLHGEDLLLGVADHGVLGVGDDHVVEADGETGPGGVTEAEVLDLVEGLDGDFETEVEVAVVDQLADALLLEQAVDVRHALGERIVEDGAADRGVDVLLVELDRLSVGEVLVVVGGGHVEDRAGVAQTDGRQRFDLLGLEGHEHFFDVREDAAFAPGVDLGLGEVVDAEDEVLRGHSDGLAAGGREDVVRGEHEYAGFDLSLRRERDVHGHLVAVEVGVEGGADERVDLDGLAFDEHRLKRLDAEAVEGRGAVEQDGVILDDLFEDVPDDGLLHLDHLLGLLDGGAVAGLLEAVIDEGLEELERHLLGQAALVQLELGADDDDRAAGVVDALAEEVLTEAALLALEGVGERLERTVVGATQDAATAAVVEQSVDGLLQHALLVADDDLRRVEVHQLLEAVVAVDDAAIEVVQVGRGEAAAVQRHERAKLGRDHGDHVEDHPLRQVVGLAEGLDDLEALGVLELLLERGLGLHALAEFDGELGDIDALEEFLDGFGAHHGLEAGGAVLLVELAEACLVLDDLALLDGRVAWIDDNVGLEVEDSFELTQADVEQVADAAGQALEEPDVRAGAGELDVAEALAADFARGDFDAALVADDAAVLHALVLAAEALPVGDGAEDAGAEEAVALGLEGAVVDGLGLGDFAMRPLRIFSGLAS